ncbi:MAG TPA: HEPN domain-containing protein [Candidatus Acidoferrales bacterium]|nr:HEPN domain-containing protein [Candidatus Acidoferrales bacterium]
MKDAYLDARFQEIDASIQKAKSSSAGDVQLQAFLASYLVVLISGYYEESVEYLIGVRAGKAGDADVQSFIRECVGKIFRSPKFENIRDLIGLFNETYKKALEKQVDEKARAAIASIVNHRHSISHGRPIAVTLGDVETFHNSSKPVFEALESILS